MKQHESPEILAAKGITKIASCNQLIINLLQNGQNSQISEQLTAC
jgi:hypothetical protein